MKSKKSVEKEVVTTSKNIAELFEKIHRDVIKTIRDLDCSREFKKSNYITSYYISPQNKILPCFNITKEGLLFLCMIFSGEKAAKQKIDIINILCTLELDSVIDAILENS